eukprot:547540_1
MLKIEHNQLKYNINQEFYLIEEKIISNSIIYKLSLIVLISDEIYEIYQQNNLNKQINLIKQQKLIFHKKYHMIYDENLFINERYYYTKTYIKYVKTPLFTKTNALHNTTNLHEQWYKHYTSIHPMIAIHINTIYINTTHI